MILRPPRSTQSRSSAASDVYKRQVYELKIKPSHGIGIFGEIDREIEISKFSLEVKNRLQTHYIRLIKSNEQKIKRVALCTGGGGSLLEQAFNKGADLYITGDINYHTALRAKELELNVLDVEHFDTEKFFVEALYNQLIKLGIPQNILIKSKKMESPYQII